MATLYLNNNNDFIYTKKDVIMQRSNMVDQMKILIPRYYGKSMDTSEDLDMLDGFDIYLHYVTPVTKRHDFLKLQLVNENYNSATRNEDIVISYKIPIDLKLTSESGKLEVWLAFYKVEVSIDENDELVMETPVRVSKPCFVPITKVSDYDNLMISYEHSSISKQILELQKLIQQANSNNQDISDLIPADVKIVNEEGKIKLVNSKDQTIGNGIDIV